jgi:hypothetical protein
MKLLTTFLVPVIAGAGLAAAAMFGLVSSQTSAPDTNPADSEVLSYGS